MIVSLLRVEPFNALACCNLPSVTEITCWSVRKILHYSSLSSDSVVCPVLYFHYNLTAGDTCIHVHWKAKLCRSPQSNKLCRCHHELLNFLKTSKLLHNGVLVVWTSLSLLLCFLSCIREEPSDLLSCSANGAVMKYSFTNSALTTYLLHNKPLWIFVWSGDKDFLTRFSWPCCILWCCFRLTTMCLCAVCLGI